MDVVVEALDHGDVVVDDRVHDPVEHGGGTSLEEVGPGLHPGTSVLQRARFSVPDDDRESLADEDLDLTELDHLDRVDVASRLQHHEQRLAVHLELRPLVCVDRILDGELVEAERGTDL